MLARRFYIRRDHGDVIFNCHAVITNRDVDVSRKDEAAWTVSSRRSPTLHVVFQISTHQRRYQNL
jgi:hypothetical protein